MRDRLGNWELLVPVFVFPGPSGLEVKSAQIDLRIDRFRLPPDTVGQNLFVLR